MGRAHMCVRITLAVAAMTLVACTSEGTPDNSTTSQPSTTHPTSLAPSAVPRPTAPRLTRGAPAWVAVSVATLWRSPDSPRHVDIPALANPARIVHWLADMTLTQRRGLSGRADTQALLGDRVRVVRLLEHWAKVVVPSQPSPLDRRGYPGWVPRRQLTAHPPAATEQQATVVARTAWLLTDQSRPIRLFRVSFGTRLPVTGLTPRFVRVVSPVGDSLRIAASAVVVNAAGAPARVPSHASLVHTARTFLGLPYLWAGASGFGLDCSGLTWLVYRVHGIAIPRDAAPQSQHGKAVTDLRRGDLMFYATQGAVHHVSMYVGNGNMIHAPGTGQNVEVVPISTLSEEYVGARRNYLP